MKFQATTIRIFLIAAFCMAFTFTGMAQGKTTKVKDINFIEDAWSDALKQAAEQNKYIFVDAYASWCGPCKMLRNTTFKDSKVVAFFNQNFVNVSIDMEKGVGPQLSTTWQIQAYPTLIILNSKGKPVYGTVGYIDAKELLKFAEQGLAKK
jgi:thioredoxin 1